MKDKFTKDWIISNSISICDRYEYGILTLRGLHYQLVGIGMTNSIQHYKRVVNAIIEARWDGLISFEQFSDHERTMLGNTNSEVTDLEDQISKGKHQVRAWMTSYSKNRWENQSYYPEVFIEKKALQGVFEPICREWDIALGACKGYPSLTFLNDSAKRFVEAVENGKTPVILYFGDYDPSGEDIPRSIEENINKLGCSNIEVQRFALMEHQVKEWKLPHAPTKETDSRSKNWDGLGQVELDAIEPHKLQQLCSEAIESIFDHDSFEYLQEEEEVERKLYVTELKTYVNNL